MAVVFEPLAPADAIAALERRGQRLDPSFAWQDVSAAEHAHSFTVAKSAGFDILTDIHKALEAALKDGQTERTFQKGITPILQEKGWWGRQIVEDPATGEPVSAQLGSVRRLQTIFQVNMRVSYAAGHWANFQRNKASRPFLRYVAILDESTRPQHALRHNLCLPVDHPYWNIWAPPCGWNCRCMLQSLSQRDVDRMGGQLKFEPPPDLLKEWLNKRTGEISQVPDGIDPGWAHNPGKLGYQAGLTSTAKTIPAPPAIAAAAMEDPAWVSRPLAEEFAGWFDAAAAGGRVERSIVAVGTLDGRTLDRLAARGTVPQSGAITVDQAAVRHMIRDAKSDAGRAVPVDTLRRMPELLSAPLAILLDRRDGQLLYVFDVPGEERLGKLVVRIDFSRQARPPGGKSQRISTNAIRTAGLVPTVTLRDEVTYELLEGVI